MIGALSLLAPIVLPIVNTVVDTRGSLAKGAINNAVDTAASRTKASLAESMPIQPYKNNQITY